jgi:Tfp pilus assembly protein PilO
MKRLSQFQWSKLSIREKILAVLTVGMMFYAGVAFYYKPRVIEREKLHTQKAALQQEVTVLSSALPVLTQKADETKVGSLSLTAAAPWIEADASLSMILEEISRQARLQEVQLIELKPNVVEKKEGYEILPLQLKTRSRFRNLGEYLALLERLPRPVTINHIKIESTAETTPYVVVDMTLHIYKKGGA